jgi:hypothetical protein
MFMRMFRALFQQSKMETMHKECITKEQHSGVHFCGHKESIQRTFTKKCLLLMVGSVYHVKWFISGSTEINLGGKHFADNEEVETQGESG